MIRDILQVLHEFYEYIDQDADNWISKDIVIKGIDYKRLNPSSITGYHLGYVQEHLRNQGTYTYQLANEIYTMSSWAQGLQGMQGGTYYLCTFNC